MRSNARSISVSFGPRPYHADILEARRHHQFRAEPRHHGELFRARLVAALHQDGAVAVDRVRHRVGRAHHRQAGAHRDLHRGGIDLVHAHFFHVPARPGLAPQLDVQALVGGRRCAKHFPRAAIVVGRRAPEVRHAARAPARSHPGSDTRVSTPAFLSKRTREALAADGRGLIVILHCERRRRGLVFRLRLGDRQRELVPRDLVPHRRPRRVVLQREADIQPVLHARLRARSSASGVL